MPLNQDQMFVKGYGFFFGKNMSKDISKNVSKNLGGKYNPSVSTASQNLFIIPNNMLQMHLKLIQKE